MAEPRFEFLFDMHVTMGEGVVLGMTPNGDVSFQHAVGGRVEGPRIKGELLPVGGDRVVGRTDGARELNVQALIRTHDNHTILMSYKGLVRPMGPPAPGWSGVPGSPGAPELYWRTAPLFETSGEPYLWLNQLMAVGLGRLDNGVVSYQVYALL